ncbi:hypothetical protein BY458DRAFT_512045 [Sporodiniella umbellata]|nr:hypothetical protein BY458DRAFT_512045 [Sporodiniella umbellata]
MKKTIQGTPCARIEPSQNPKGHLKLLYENNKCLVSQTVSSPILCTHAIPLSISIPDFLAFITPVESYVTHYQTLREETEDTYMVLLHFKESQAADIYYRQYHHRPFSSLEPELCQIVYIQSIEIDPSQPLFSLAHAEETCSVCLEPLDESKSGVLTIFCQHAFHCHCLLKWRDGSCPVCRYSQNKPRLEPKERVREERAEENECSQCRVTENLWICLICGHVGCGRYHQAHAYEHFKATDHVYALEIRSERVWDYASDGFVHRLVQNMADGKLVELPAQDQEPKPETVALDYSCLLTTQLDSQRMDYEDQIDRLSARIAHLVHRLKQIETQHKALLKENEGTDRAIKIKDAQLSKHTLDKKRAQLLHTLALSQWEDLKDLYLKEKEASGITASIISNPSIQ